MQAVVPGNGEELADAPAEVVLTFAQDLPGDATAAVRVPGGDVPAAAVQVDGRDLLVAVPDAGPGSYEVQYVVGDLTGSTGYTVLQPGQAPTPEPGGTAGLAVSVLLAVALVAVIAMTVQRWRRR